MKIINQPSYNRNVNPQFKRLRFPHRNLLSRSGVSEISANMLQQDEQTILKLTKDASQNKLRFLKELADNYNRKYFAERNPEKIESSVLVNNIYKLVAKPTEQAIKLANYFNGKFETLERTFKAIDNDDKKLNFAYIVNKEIVNNSRESRPEIIAELLESKNNKSYIKNYNKYKSYLLLNHNNKDAVNKLDQLVNTKNYDARIYNEKLQLKNNKKVYTLSETDVLNSNVYAYMHNKDRESILNTIVRNSRVMDSDLKQNIDKEILKTLTTTNKKNIKIRTNLIEKYPESNQFTIHQENTLEYFTNMNKLFNKIDNNPNAREFVEHSINNVNRLQNIKQLNDILDNVDNTKLAFFKENATNIIEKTSSNNRIEILNKEIHNPFYGEIKQKPNKNKTDIYSNYKPESKIKRFFKKVSNRIKIAQYNLLYPDTKIQISKPIIKENIPTVTTKDSIEQVKTHKDTTTNSNTYLKGISMDMKKPFANTFMKIKTNMDRNNEKLVDKIHKKISSKLEIQDEVIKIANSKLGEKTFAKQKDLFEKNANKIRLKLLSEMFASITQTRKTDKLLNRRSMSSNKDVLELYMLTNGQNKKLVEYMLKKRKNNKATRMFEVKEIINTIKNAKIKIAEDKKANPKYRANDARKYYNQLYEEKIAEFGKSTNPTNVSA